MNYQHLLYFKALAEQQHYTKASHMLHISQPALTKAIHGMETELGVHLFQKTGRNVTLTKYGSIFYTYVSQAIMNIDTGIDKIRHEAALDSNTVFISALNSLYNSFLPQNILSFRRMHPDVHFRTEYKFTSAVIEDVLSGNSELGICSAFETDGECANLNRSVLFYEPVSLIVSKTHPFAAQGIIPVSALKDERFIAYYISNRGTNKILQDLCAPYGFSLSMVQEGYNDIGVLSLVASGEGIAIIPTTNLVLNPDVVPVKLDIDGPLQRTIFLIWDRRRSLPPLAKAFRSWLLSPEGKDSEFK